MRLRAISSSASFAAMEPVSSLNFATTHAAVSLGRHISISSLSPSTADCVRLTLRFFHRFCVNVNIIYLLFCQSGSSATVFRPSLLSIRCMVPTHGVQRLPPRSPLPCTLWGLAKGTTVGT